MTLDEAIDNTYIHEQYEFWSLFSDATVPHAWVGTINYVFWRLSNKNMTEITAESFRKAYYEMAAMYMGEFNKIKGRQLEILYAYDHRMEYRRNTEQLADRYPFNLSLVYNVQRNALEDVVYAFGRWSEKWSDKYRKDTLADGTFYYTNIDADDFGIGSISMNDFAQRHGVLDENGTYKIDYELFARSCLKAYTARVRNLRGLYYEKQQLLETASWSLEDTSLEWLASNAAYYRSLSMDGRGDGQRTDSYIEALRNELASFNFETLGNPVSMRY
jgi:hypothetical protein